MLLPLLFLSVMMGFRLIEIETNASRRFVKILGPEFVPPALVKIQGVVNPFARRIHITFEKDNENFIFHMSIRFDEKKNVVVINSQTNGTWGEEERVLSYFPFAPSQGFEA
uniref:Galectin n=1 Tax=Geotrypetes seraphini TaxID=260995 RepID=A0A6P8RVP3_GEOSA|nr:galectin-9-like isoform X2 [Geotrypetes seraphini]